MRRLVPLMLVCALATLTLPAGRALAASGHHRPTSAGAQATAAEGNRILNDCQSHGQLTHVYTRAELKKALSMLSSGTAQYSDCSTVINAALLHDIKGGGGGGSGGSGTTIVIIVAAVLVALAVLLAGLALRRRHGPGGPAPAA